MTACPLLQSRHTRRGHGRGSGSFFRLTCSRAHPLSRWLLIDSIPQKEVALIGLNWLIRSYSLPRRGKVRVLPKTSMRARKNVNGHHCPWIGVAVEVAGVGERTWAPPCSSSPVATYEIGPTHVYCSSGVVRFQLVNRSST